MNEQSEPLKSDGHGFLGEKNAYKLGEEKLTMTLLEKKDVHAIKLMTSSAVDLEMSLIRLEREKRLLMKTNKEFLSRWLQTTTAAVGL